MSFLDNLENSLKSLESQEERDPAAIERQNQANALKRAAGPWAERLKQSPFTQALFDQATLSGHRLRTKIYMSWADDVLTFAARDRRMELRATPDGIIAAFIEPDRGESTRTVDLGGDPAALMNEWLRIS